MKIKRSGLKLNFLIILSFFVIAQVYLNPASVLTHGITKDASNTEATPFMLTSIDGDRNADPDTDSGELSFVTAYSMNYSETDSTIDDEIWISIVGSTTHVQISDNDYDEKAASVATAPNGNIIVVWEYYNETIPKWFVVYAVLDYNGYILKPDSILDNGSDPCVAVTPDGVLFIVLEESGYPDNLIIQIMNDDGVPLKSIEVFRTGDVDDPTVTASTLNTNNNNVVIAWEERDVYGINQIWFMILDSNGGTVKDSTQVTYSDTGVRDVNAAIMPNGDIGLVWAKTSNSSYEQIWYAVYDGGGDPVKEATQLTYSEAESEEPAIAASPNSAVIVWEESGNEIYYALIDGDGEVSRAPALLNTWLGDDDDVDVATDSDGNIVVVWEQQITENPPPYVDRVVYSLLDSEGTVLESMVHVTDAGGDPYRDADVDGDHGCRFIAMNPIERDPSFVYSNWVKSAVSVDGVWSPGEWEDAAESHVTGGVNVEYEYYLYVKNDDSWIYVCVDAVGDDTLDGFDFCFLYFDTGHDEVRSNNGEDTLVIVGTLSAEHLIYNTTSGILEEHCTSTNGVPFTDNSRDESGTTLAIGYGVSPNSNSHRIYEFKIPMALGELNAYPGYNASMRLWMSDSSPDTMNNWPSDANSTDMSTWGDIIVSDASTSLSDFPTYFSDNRVKMIFPSDQPNKTLGCSPASVSDWLASAFVSTKLNNVTEGLDTDPSFVNQTSGKAIVEPVYGIVSFGGPIVNPVVKHAESNTTLIDDRAPVKFVNEGVNGSFKHWNGSDISGAELPWSHVNDDQDMFVIELYVDSSNRNLMLCYGLGWKGTYAAGKYFDSVIYPHSELYPYSWIIVKWEDTNMNGFVNTPGEGDTYTIIATGK